MPFYEYAQAQTLIQLAHQNQTTVGGHPSALEIDLQRAIEGELKGPILSLTHRLSTSAPLRSHPNPHPSARLAHFIKLVVTEITEIRVQKVSLTHNCWNRRSKPCPDPITNSQLSDH